MQTEIFWEEQEAAQSQAALHRKGKRGVERKGR
jgi:hypothetical protein